MQHPFLDGLLIGVVLAIFVFIWRRRIEAGIRMELDKAKTAILTDLDKAKDWAVGRLKSL
jgi:MFS superfamily sulfate permease-like transporter